MQRLLKASKKQLAQKFNFTDRYIKNVLSLYYSVIFTPFIYVNLKVKLRQNPAHLPHTLILISTLTVERL